MAYYVVQNVNAELVAYNCLPLSLLVRGPMIPGIPPREASDRLNIFQLHFDDLWRKFQTYSGGEELFGLEVTDYPELQRIRKELNLLQKLYQLYNNVLDRVRGYYDIAWVEIDIDKINTELIDFQNKYAELLDFLAFIITFNSCRSEFL